MKFCAYSSMLPTGTCCHLLDTSWRDQLVHLFRSYFYSSQLLFRLKFADAAFFPPTAFQVKAYGPGLEKTGVAVNKPAEFTVDAKSGGKAPLKVQVQVRWEEEWSQLP